MDFLFYICNNIKLKIKDMGFKGTKGKWVVSFKDKVKCGDKVICEVFQNNMEHITIQKNK